MTQMISLEKRGRTAGKPHRALSEGDGHRWPTIGLRCVNGSRAESGCTPQHGLGGEIEEIVDESHFACDPGFDQDAMAASDHAHDLEALERGVSGLHRLEARRLRAERR